MSWSPRYLPSISMLRAFEAVMRTGATTAAADELHMTQAAVSRHVQRLEAQLGAALFRREKRRLVPTPAGRHYAEAVSRALDLIGRASMELTANPGGGTLSLAILPAFGTRWLAPGLAAFQAAHPGVTLHLTTRLRPVDFETEAFDAAIHFGAADRAGCGHLHLADEPMLAVASPGVLERHPPHGPAAIAAMPLLHLQSRPRAWERWFAHHGQAAPAQRGMVFDQFAPMTQAAIHGLGVALLPPFLAEPEIAEGRLRPAWGAAVPGRGGYWLVWPHARDDYPPLAAFRDWLAAEVRGGQGGAVRSRPAATSPPDAPAPQSGLPSSDGS
ncbi:LysR substrate-binding domain-containing protein [Rhodosalinus sp. 5P4]|uniref:LysR substrate-binding domain-containing protein n=1 Tax=Rhodosalinus sp. 5P4 TaxID=3239196 RepID=UPI003523EDFA